LATLKRLRNIRTLWRGAALMMVFFAETSHYAHARAKALLGEWKNCRALSLPQKAHVGGFV
jgi:hypothetical protein